MKRSRVTELHYIAPFETVGSILQHGLVSHNLAKRIPHRSIASEAVQQRRSNRLLPNGRYLHDHVNLYFDARNPMMYYLCHHENRESLAVIRVSRNVLDLPLVLVADGNAASGNAFGGTRFYPSGQGIEMLEEDRVYCEYWTDSDPIVQREYKRKRCAEVLVPNSVKPDNVLGVFVVNEHSRQMLLDHKYAILVTVSEHMFFS